MPCCGQNRASLSLTSNQGASSTRPTQASSPISSPVSSHSPHPTPNARAANPTPPSRVAQAAGTPVSFGMSLMLCYLERSPITVRGAVTGRQYAFSMGTPVQSVDVRDAEVLLRTAFFRRASSPG